MGSFKCSAFHKILLRRINGAEDVRDSDHAWGEKGEKHPILIEDIKGKRLFRRHEAWTEVEAYIEIYLEESDWEVVD